MHIGNLEKMKKSERLELIKKLILAHEIETQHELLERLEKEGLKPTQATISRDMNEIGIVKIPSQSGKYIYGLSKNKNSIIMPQPINFSEILLDVSRLENMINIDVVPGNSRLVKRRILDEWTNHIFSLIADDDSLLLVAKTSEVAKTLENSILGWE